VKDKSYINYDLKKLDRLKKREYRKHGRSEKYRKLKTKFDQKLEKAAADHLEKNVRTLKETDPGRAYSTLKKMGAQPGDMLDDGAFSLLNHLEDNLTSKESVEKLPNIFHKSVNNTPPWMFKNCPNMYRIK
jgi:hypothetical protein